jgi:hypothetical protein
LNLLEPAPSGAFEPSLNPIEPAPSGAFEPLNLSFP